MRDSCRLFALIRGEPHRTGRPSARFRPQCRSPQTPVRTPVCRALLGPLVGRARRPLDIELAEQAHPVGRPAQHLVDAHDRAVPVRTLVGERDPGRIHDRRVRRGRDGVEQGGERLGCAPAGRSAATVAGSARCASRFSSRLTRPGTSRGAGVAGQPQPVGRVLQHRPSRAVPCTMISPRTNSSPHSVTATTTGGAGRGASPAGRRCRPPRSAGSGSAPARPSTGRAPAPPPTARRRPGLHHGVGERVDQRAVEHRPAVDAAPAGPRRPAA